ncbi:hypothetical protein FHS96_005440 [Sphingomonas zeicaulis]|uniref:hypothetical protein n=1 Tax=Sphingomonas zeicaulis TaxID=1632740 RepID=UPI003D1A9933
MTPTASFSQHIGLPQPPRLRWPGMARRCLAAIGEQAPTWLAMLATVGITGTLAAMALLAARNLLALAPGAVR